jgi:hypothetical protein
MASEDSIGEFKNEYRVHSPTKDEHAVIVQAPDYGAPTNAGCCNSWMPM